MADTHDRDASSAPEPANENPSFNPFTRFPEMKPIRGVPTLQTMNGVGLSMVGRRDVDPETGTYVKTHCFVFLFIPLMALGAYRVFDAPEGGWYFLGRVPLSSTARRWNWIFALLVAVGIGAGGWFSYTRTPEYKAGVVLAQGDRLAAEGKGREAAGLYRQVFLGKSDRAAEGGQRLLGMLDHPPENMAETAGAFEVLLELHRQDRLPIKDLFDRAMTLATQHEQNDPAGTLQLLEVVAPLASDPQGQLAIRRRILERLVDREPGNIALVSRLATVCEQIGDLARCEAVLTPVKDKLGSSDGAAILGRLYASQGKFDQAYALLQPFVEARLDKLRSAEVLYRGAISAVEARVINMLKSQNAPGFDFEKARNAGPDQVGLMVQEYRDAQMRDDAGVRDAQQQLAAQAAVVPATLDLGMVLLHLAQAQPDADRRRDLLVKAENTFLAIQGVAGDSDRYRLNLGQVYYWLGKAPEAKKQFDDFLEKHNQSADAVSAVSRVLREVGATSEARKILETAYAKETATEAKQNLAASRSVLFTDLDDKILWLGRANPNNPDTQATLLHARGSRALVVQGSADAVHEAAGERGDAEQQCHHPLQPVSTDAGSRPVPARGRQDGSRHSAASRRQHPAEQRGQQPGR
jgi:tetratricopeptide (TPR) repeat protein